MDTAVPDFRIAPLRLSLGVLAAVLLVHLGVLMAILTLPDKPSSYSAPTPLYVRLIEPPAVRPEVIAPAETAARPPAPSKPTPPVLATPAAPTPARVEVVRADPLRPAPQPVPAPVAAPPSANPVAAPAPIASDAPTPAPAPAPLPVTQPRFNADYLDNPKPPYPSLSRRMGEEGEVRLRVQVDANGNAQQVELYRSSGFPRLDQTALDTVRQWRFVPARQGDQPVPAWVIVPIQFSLRS